MVDVFKTKFDGFTGNDINSTNDSLEIEDWTFKCVRRCVDEEGDTIDDLKTELENIVVSCFNRAGKNPNSDTCGFKFPELLYGAPMIIEDAFPNAKYLFIDRELIPYSCNRRKSHETTYQNHPAGAVVYPTAFSNYYRRPVNWNIAEHLKMALIWTYNQIWRERCHKEIGSGNFKVLKTEDLLSDQSSFISKMASFLGLSENNVYVEPLDPNRLKLARDCDMDQAKEVWEIGGDTASGHGQRLEYKASASTDGAGHSDEAEEDKDVGAVQSAPEGNAGLS